MSLGIALALFFLLEYVRILNVPIVGPFLSTVMLSHIDERDAGPMIMTHTYLLLGCALPLWWSSEYGTAALSGIITVGVGDAAGAVFGSTWGKHHWGSHKTIEGSTAVFVSIMLATYIFCYRVETLWTLEGVSS